jgi:hypothetical protein
LATKGAGQPEDRALYQKMLYSLMRPVFEEREPLKTGDLRIIEDCLASGETIAGVLTALKERTTIGVKGKIRVDVAVATTQGVLILREFAKQNELNLELNVGYLAYGLSAGTAIKGSEARAHANYITYPPEFVKNLPPEIRNRLGQCLNPESGNIEVVGDMGDFGKSLPEDFEKAGKYPWNKYRTQDPHGERGPKETTLYQSIDSQIPICMFFADGGYLELAMWRSATFEDVLRKVNIIVLDAKRVWAEKEGYGVLMGKVPKELIVTS